MEHPTSVSEFMECAAKIRGDWFKGEVWGPWFRGQRNSSWSLCPKLYRPEYGGCERIKAEKMEDEIREEFIKRAPVLCDTLLGGSDVIAEWQWYFMMQHFRAPTRLLDWTEGALIALYFAVADDPGSDHRKCPKCHYRWSDDGSTSDAVVWVLDPYVLNTKALGKDWVIPPSATGLMEKDRKLVAPWLPRRFAKRHRLPQQAIAIEPTHTAQRISSQHSCFTIHGEDRAAIDKLEVENAKDGCLVKIIIPGSKVQAIRRDLRLSGIDELTIFPDLDGLGRSISSRWEQLGQTDLTEKRKRNET